MEAQKTFLIFACGGRGIRLRDINPNDIPKSLFPVFGVPLISHTLKTLNSPGIAGAIFATGHKGDEVRRYIDTLSLPYPYDFCQSEGLGAFGAIYRSHQMLPRSDLPIFACNTDEIRFPIPILDHILAHHYKQDFLATVLGAPADRLHRHRVISSQHGHVTTTMLKPGQYQLSPDIKGIVNTGLVVLTREAFSRYNPAISTDWSGILDPICEEGRLGVYISRGTIYHNVGTAEELTEAENDPRLVPTHV